jgi:hypothetical protein
MGAYFTDTGSLGFSPASQFAPAGAVYREGLWGQLFEKFSTNPMLGPASLFPGEGPRIYIEAGTGNSLFLQFPQPDLVPGSPGIDSVWARLDL